MKNTSEQLLSFAENELIKKESIRRAVLNSAPDKQKKPIAWTKILLPIAACLVLLCGTVFAIPSARAEVLSWFRGGGPENYLAVAPEDRTPVPVLDELIVPPAPTEAPENTQEDALKEGPAPVVSDVPIGSVTDNRVLLVCDESIWQQIAESFSIELGETMFDGKNLYLTVTYHGLTALPDTVDYYGGCVTATCISDEDLPEYYEDGSVPEIYMRNDVHEWESNFGRYWLELPNGVQVFLGKANLLSASKALNAEFSKFGKQLEETYPGMTDSEQYARSREMIAWLPGKSLTGVIRGDTRHGDYGYLNGTDIPIEELRQYLLDQADENGILEAKVLYKLGPLGTYLTAEVGTAQFDLKAWERLDRHNLAAVEEKAVCGPQKAILSHTDWIETTYDETTCAVTNTEADLEGLTFTASDAAYLDGLGIHDIRITVTMPESWTDEDCEAFRENLRFFALIADEYYSLSSDGLNEHDGHTFSYLLSVTRVPYDRIESFDTIRIVPYLMRLTGMQVNGEIIPLEPNVQLAEPDTTGSIGWVGVDTELTSGILTFVKRP